MIITIEEVAMIITALAIAIMIQSALDFLTKKIHKKGFKSWI
jgi:hypothetical protein